MSLRLNRLSLKVAVFASAPILAVAAAANTATAAAPSCTTANFTANGNFDLDGYLACLAGGAPAAGGGGTLPTTGSDVMRLLAVGIGLGVVGVGAIVAAKRRPEADVLLEPAV